MAAIYVDQDLTDEYAAGAWAMALGSRRLGRRIAVLAVSSLAIVGVFHLQAVGDRDAGTRAVAALDARVTAAVVSCGNSVPAGDGEAGVQLSGQGGD
jgi:hypothetical protein